MIKEFIGAGKTIEEATLAAKTGLNAPLTADVKIEIVEMPKKKIFGLFGGNDAKVKASYDDGSRPRKPQQKRNSGGRKPAQKKNAPVKEAPFKETKKAFKSERTAAVSEAPVEKITAGDVDLDYACKYLKTMIDSFKVNDAKITAEVEDGVVVMNVECDDYGIIIGRRGETLDSLQYLTSLAIKKSTDKYVRVTLNVGNYREKRAETLRNLAVKNANFVSRTGRRYTFEPMNPYERRIIHTAIQEVEGVVSRSVGTGNERKVLIEPEGGVRRGGYSNRRPSRPRSESASPVQTAARPPRADRAGAPKFGKIEVNKD